MTIPISIRCFFILLYKIMTTENDMKCWNTVDFIKCNKISVCFFFHHRHWRTSNCFLVLQSKFKYGFAFRYIWNVFDRPKTTTRQHIRSQQYDDRLTKKKTKAKKNGVEDISRSMRFHRMFNCAVSTKCVHKMKFLHVSSIEHDILSVTATWYS